MNFIVMDSLWQNYIKKIVEMSMNKETFKKALQLTSPVFFGYIFVAIAFALLMKEKGMTIWHSLSMSIFVYAGAMQFAAIELIVSGVSLIQVAFMTLLVNIRHIFYGLSLMKPYREMKHEKVYFIHSLSDETYSLLCMNKEYDTKLMLMIGLLNQSYWVSGTLIGSLIGEVIAFDTTGIDFAMNALFLVVFIEQWQSSKEHVPALVGLFSTLLCLVIFGKENMVVMSMILILFSLFVYRRMNRGKCYE